MLYVSRQVGPDTYGIVDTDDDSETYVSYGDMLSYMEDLGIQVEGFELKHDIIGNHFLRYTGPYQDKRYAKGDAVRLKVMRGVDIRTFRGEIVYILMDANVMPDNLRVKLSDYGSLLSCTTPVLWETGNLGKHITLVLDNNINLTGDNVFLTPYGTIRYDVTEMQNPDVVYNTLLECHGDRYADWRDLIDDIDKRLLYWQCVAFIRAAFTDDAFVDSLQSSPAYSSISRLIGDKHKRDFKKLLGIKLSMPIPMRDWRTFKKQNFNDNVPEKGSFEELRKYADAVCTFLRYCGANHKSTLYRFSRYIGYFKATDELQKLYLDLYAMFIKTIKEVY